MKISVLRIVLCLLAFSHVSSVAEPISTLNVNAVRQAAGLLSLAPSETLTRAADAHADYLAKYLPIHRDTLKSAHEQNPTLPEFTGHLASDRVRYFGYPHSQVLENISLGNLTIADSVSDLMSAIYHRFAFLDFEVDEIGAASVAQRYVYELGKQDLSRVCLSEAADAAVEPGYDCLGTRVKKTKIDQTCANLPEQARYVAPYLNSCPNGKLLDAQYMRALCLSPPSEAKFQGFGGYYAVCQDGTKIRSAWLDKICAAKENPAHYGHSARAYQICRPPVQVHAAWYENFCRTIPNALQIHDTGRYYNVCSNGFKIKTEYYRALEAKRFVRQPEAVLWPADQVGNINPAFYDESPHPTPDLPLTGYPISIQFNPAKVDQVSITGFTLEKRINLVEDSWQTVTGFRRIDHLNDIHHQFTRHQFAWFPLQRLSWGAHYRYQIYALLDGVPRQYQASFSTLGFELPIVRIEAGEREITVPNKRFILYRAPSEYDPFPFRDVNLRYRGRRSVEAEVIDANTLKLNITGLSCQAVYIETRLGEEIKVNPCRPGNWRSIF